MNRNEILSLVHEIAKAAKDNNIKRIEIEFQENADWKPERVKKISYERI